MQDAYAAKVEPIRPTSLSFFRLLQKLWKGKECAPAPLHRFFTLMRKMGARGYVREALLLNSELLAEQEMARKRCGNTVTIKKVTRLTFFASLPRSREWRDKDSLPDEHLLGYVVIVTLRLPDKSWRTFLLEAVIQSPAVTFDDGSNIYILPVPNYYVHNTRRFTTSVGTKENFREFSFQGSFFTQQNDLTSVCAHAALRTAINSSISTEYLKKKTGIGKLTNEYINNILGLDSSTSEKKIGHYTGDDLRTKEGLTRQDIKRVVESLGLRLVVTDFIGEFSVDYDEFMYPAIESSCPTILEVQGWDIRENRPYAHALAVVGHTLNSDRWEPEANVGYGNYPVRRYISACEWVCHYVISDDNYGMNVTLPSDMIRNDIVPYKNPNLHAMRVMSIMPPEVTLGGYRSQKIAMDIATILIKGTRLPRKNFWLDQLKKAVKRRNLVCRTLLQKAGDYVSYIEQQESNGLLKRTTEQKKYCESLPEYLWVTEISLPNLYTGNKTKLGDVLIDAGFKEEEVETYKCFVLSWFPGFMCFQGNNLEPWYLKKHVPLIRRERKPLIEW